MGLFKKIKKLIKKSPGNILANKIRKTIFSPFKQAIGGLFKGPKIPGVTPPASAPTFASAGGPAARAGFTGAALGPSLISSGGITGLTKRAKTKKRSLIGGA